MINMCISISEISGIFHVEDSEVIEKTNKGIEMFYYLNKKYQELYGTKLLPLEKELEMFLKLNKN